MIVESNSDKRTRFCNVVSTISCVLCQSPSIMAIKNVVDFFSYSFFSTPKILRGELSQYSNKSFRC